MAAVPHCHYCFETLASRLEHRKSLTLPQIEALYREQQQQHGGRSNGVVLNGVATNGTNGVTNRVTNGVTNGTTYTNGNSVAAAPARPLFVTWNKLSRSGNKNLRGCIGTFEAQPLDYGLRSYALTAFVFPILLHAVEARTDVIHTRALDDTRFNPISLKELPSLECGVTLLTDFEPATSSMDWTLGTHGLRINFVYHGRRMGATYLPDVPVEQGWTKEETVVSLMRKAGWTGRKEEWRKVDLNVVRYKGTKATVSYNEYRALVDGTGSIKRTGALDDDEDEEEDGDDDEGETDEDDED